MEDDPGIARTTLTVDADLKTTRTMIEGALKRLTVVRSSFDEDARQYTFHTGMTWRSWWQETEVQLVELPEGRCQLRLSS
jgi:hypothetical protein